MWMDGQPVCFDKQASLLVGLQLQLLWLLGFVLFLFLFCFVFWKSQTDRATDEVWYVLYELKLICRYVRYDTDIDIRAVTDARKKIMTNMAHNALSDRH